MNNRKRKSLDEFLRESKQFEEKFEDLRSAEYEETERERLIAELRGWLQDGVWQGRFLPYTSAERVAFESLLGRWSSNLRAHGYFIEGIDDLEDFDPYAGIVLDVECPYPGLSAYAEDQSGKFFGREAFVSECVVRLGQQGNRILMIIGASGSGKSSVALAGILPRLKERHNQAWLFAPKLTPGADPLEELANSVSQAIERPDQAAEIKHVLASKPNEARGTLVRLCRDKSLMLFIDQFEELFTLCRGEAERKAFAEVLYALSDPDQDAFLDGFSCRTLLTMRTDHLSRIQDSDAMKPLCHRLIGEDNLLVISDIGLDDIKRAIKEPAAKIGLHFIPANLVDELATQTFWLSNGLPLLQFSLLRLWDTRPKDKSTDKPLDMVTEEMVKKLPDVARALGTAAKGIFKKLNKSQRKICERLLLELVVLDESFEEPLRRRRNETELKQMLQTRFPKNPGDVTRVIDDFVKAKLLRRFGDGPESQLEVAHEALLRHWKHINDLLTGAEVKERLHRVKQIGREARDWVSSDRSRSYLNLKGERLVRALQYETDGWLAEAEVTAYVKACNEQEEAERLKDEQAVEAARQAKRYRRRMWWAVAASLLIVLGGAVYFKWVKPAQELRSMNEAIQKLSYGFYLLQANDPGAEKRFVDAIQDSRMKGLQLCKLAIGLLALKKGNYHDANESFGKVIEMSTNNHDPLLYTYYYYKGKSCRGLLYHDEAKKSFDEAIECIKNQPKDTQSDDVLSLYYYERGRTNLDRNEIEKAEEDFKEGIALAKDGEAANHYGLGQVYFRKGNFPAAKDEFKKAIELSLRAKNINYEDLLVYQYHLSLSHFGLGEIADAEKASPFNKGFALGGDMEAAYRNLIGNLYINQGNTKAATTQFEIAADLSWNGNDSYLFDLGRAYLANQNWADAIKVFSKLGKKELEDPSKRLDVIQAYASEAKRIKEEKETAKAIEYAKNAEGNAKEVLIIPQLTELDKRKAYTLLGDSYMVMGKYQDAINNYKEAEEISPMDAFLALYLAEAYFEEHQRQEAEHYVNEAERREQKDPQLRTEGANGAKEFFNKRLERLKQELNNP